MTSEKYGFLNLMKASKDVTFCKILINLEMLTPSYMIYGELGCYSMDVDIKVRTISYWTKLFITGKQSKLSFYIQMYVLF